MTANYLLNRQFNISEDLIMHAIMPVSEESQTRLPITVLKTGIKL